MKHDDPTQHDSIPAALLDAMRAVDRQAHFDDHALAELDSAVLSGARQHLASIAQRRRMRLVFACTAAGSGLAAAAAITLVVWMGGLGSTSNPPAFTDSGNNNTAQTPVDPGPDAGEVPGAGVDILDAFALARQKRDGDDQINQAMIDTLAQRAVSVSTAPGGGRG